MDNPRRRRFLAYFNGPPFRGDRKALMERTGLTKGRVAQLHDEKEPFGDVAARRLAERLDLPPDFFEKDTPTLGEFPGPRMAVAQSVSLRPAKVTSLITWEALMKGEHEEEFIVALPDDSMSPKAAAGLMLIFTTEGSRSPAFGSWVIVRSGSSFFVRQYRESDQDEWEAHPFNDAFRTLYPSRDALNIIAVMKGVLKNQL